MGSRRVVDGQPAGSRWAVGKYLVTVVDLWAAGGQQNKNLLKKNYFMRHYKDKKKPQPNCKPTVPMRIGNKGKL